MSNEKDFTITRTFNAPRTLVWKMHTELEHLKQWWGPPDFVMDYAKLDLRPGGMFHYKVSGANGAAMWGKFVYKEVVPESKLVFVVSFSDEHAGETRNPFLPVWPLEILNTLTLEEFKGQTIMKLSGHPINATAEETAKFHEAAPGLSAGFGASYDRMEQLLSKK